MISYKHAVVDGNKIFYREAGSAAAPTILLLHGFPTLTGEPAGKVVVVFVDTHYLPRNGFPPLGILRSFYLRFIRSCRLRPESRWRLALAANA